MRFFTPRFNFATLMPPQDRLLSKIGGLPWGLPRELWPSCCGKPQKLLAQLCHQPPMLDLGAEDMVLHLFQCMECLGIANEAGCAAFIVPRSQLVDALARTLGCEMPGDMGDGLIGEAWISGWDEGDDGIPESRLRDFYTEKTVWAIQDEYSEIDWFDWRQMTRFGGTPRWTGNGPMGFPLPPFEFLFQLNCGFHMPGSPPSADEVGCDIHTQTYVNGRVTSQSTIKPRPENKRLNAPWGIVYTLGAEHYEFQYTNLGTDGTVFVFTDRTRTPHAVRWFWNR